MLSTTYASVTRYVPYLPRYCSNLADAAFDPQIAALWLGVDASPAAGDPPILAVRLWFSGTPLLLPLLRPAARHRPAGSVLHQVDPEVEVGVVDEPAEFLLGVNSGHGGALGSAVVAEVAPGGELVLCKQAGDLVAGCASFRFNSRVSSRACRGPLCRRRRRRRRRRGHRRCRRRRHRRRRRCR